MFKSTLSKLKGIFNGQSYVKKTVNKNSLQDEPNETTLIVEREQLETTPFWMMRTEKKWFLVMGDSRLSPNMNSKAELLKWYKNNQWQLIMQLFLIMKRRDEEIQNMKN